MKQGFPLAVPGQAIGLFGGSFDPAHAGHVHVSRWAMRRFGLSRLWWLVSPGNPLKSRGPAPLAERLLAARRIMPDPHVEITDLEARLGTRMTVDTLTALRHAYPGVRFVWLMGSDNLVQFHHWDDWRRIAQLVPIGVVTRPGSLLPARLSRSARILASHRLPAERAHLLARMAPPVWCMVNIPLNTMSSTAIRAGRPDPLAEPNAKGGPARRNVTQS